jgi:hypothetical protein
VALRAGGHNARLAALSAEDSRYWCWLHRRVRSSSYSADILVTSKDLYSYLREWGFVRVLVEKE